MITEVVEPLYPPLMTGGSMKNSISRGSMWQTPIIWGTMEVMMRGHMKMGRQVVGWGRRVGVAPDIILCE